MLRSRTLVAVFCLIASLAGAGIWAAPRTAPPPGLRENTPRVHALVGGKLVLSPEQTIEKGTLVIRDGVIVAVGEAVTPPADARIWNVAGKTLYPGFVDAYSELPADASRSAVSETAGAGYWNANIVPQVRAHALYAGDGAANRKLRGQGITNRLVAPSAGIIKGVSALVSTGDGSGKQVIVRDQVALHLKLTVARGVGGYPNSPMGAYTLVRQAFYDAGWQGQAWDAYRQNAELPRPERSDALEVLRGYLGSKLPVIIDASDDLYLLRADRIANEFALAAIVRGSGHEYRRIDAVKATGRAVIVPLNFPKPPNVATPEAAMNVTLERLMHWELAPENAGRLDAVGVKIALTSHGLSDSGAFLTAVRKAVKRGLKPEAALRALTITPAELCGASDRLGTLAVGKAANLVVANGPLFVGKNKVLETWVDGDRYEVEPDEPLDVRGTWAVELAGADGKPEAWTVELAGKPDKLSGKLKRAEKSTPLVSPKLVERQLVASFKGTPVDLAGVVQLSATISLAVPDELSWLGTVVWADGTSGNTTAKRTDKKVPAADEKKPDEKKLDDKKLAEKVAEKKPAVGADENAKEADVKETDAKDKDAKEPDAKENDAADKPAEKALSVVNFPLGDYGRAARPEQPKLVLFKNATIWTSGPQGRLENADMLIADGKIQAIGPGLTAPEGAMLINALGKHLSPGIIDCHSHAATDGGINEAGQTITAEVRIGDFIDPTDINIYRQLAGGVTAANILHGSANTIGGQNQVVKFRWGSGPEEMKLATAPPGIKFALGENVKQSNRIAERGPARYPQTRMGVEQLVRDAFQAAIDYRQAHDTWNRTKAGIPPRVDLELEALAEVIEGKRLVHCHSYRQDEILALLRTCEQFGVKIATFQHILEGYKVADAIAKHGAGGSSFSDWWAYKWEVYDAIPHNGALLHNAGVVVSFNSDNAELARRLNLEAAKAVKYGGVPPEEALKFVTLNPAKQLKIDGQTGSLELGKDADLVVWSTSPLSTYSRCEQTWVDGRRYFDLEEDRKTRGENAALKAQLVQRILASGEPTAGPGEGGKERWPNEDTYCDHGDDHGHGHQH